MSARVRILAELRRALSESGTPEAREAAVAERLGTAGRQLSPTPAQGMLGGEAGLAQFEEKLRGVDASVSRIPSLDALPEALAAELRGRNMGLTVRMGGDPDLAGLDWSGLETSHGPGRPEEPATISRGAVGVAETGTVALRSGPDNPVTLTFLGETHFIVLKASEIVPGLDEMWRRIRAGGPMSRTVNLVTGPSRSADIGQVLQLGAHGPVALHVFVVEDAAS